MTYYNNIYFLAIARKQGPSAVTVASYAYNSQTDVSIVNKVLEQPNMNIQAGKHYTFGVDRLGGHVISDDNGVMYLLFSNADYPQRVAHACLEEFKLAATRKVGEKALTAKEKALNHECQDLMLIICQKYDNLNEVDKLSAVQKKVDSVKLVMQDNVDLALKNCVKLESIEKAAEELQQQAGVFKRNANELKNKMWWKNLKMKLIIGFIILAILGIIIGVAVGMSKN